MFLCGNFCNNTPDQSKNQILVSNIDEVRKIEKELRSHVEEGASELSVKLSTAMIKSSKYDKYLENCKKTNTEFVDKEFPTNSQSLNYSVPNREITWRRISQIIPDFLMVQNQIRSSDIYQGKIGDCYFLASIASLAMVPKLIQNIFLNNFSRNGNCIYKVIANVEGVITEVIIDDFVPVFATTNRPVFCKANGRQAWVMLLEKAWAKIKGSYGAISAGTPHEVFNTFCMAPSFTYAIHEDHSQQYKDMVWNELLECAKLQMPTCAGSRKEVTLNGIKPLHAYTVLNVMSVPVGGKNHRLIRLRNPWGSTEYNGYASENDKKFWDQVPIQLKNEMLPPQGVDDGDFVMPFSQIIKHFQCLEVCHFRPDFSYQFQFLHLTQQQPSFTRLEVNEDHEAYITLQKVYKEQAKKQLSKGSQYYGYTRLIIAREQGPGHYQYFQSKLQTSFGDTTLRCNFTQGNYLIMVQASYPSTASTFKSVLSYYYSPLQDRANKKLTVLKNNSPNKMQFLTSLLTSHAHRLSSQGDTTKLSARPQDKIITTLLNQQGGYGYIVCSLQQNTNFKLRILVDFQEIENNGFELLTDIGNNTQLQIHPGSYQIFIFAVNLNKDMDQLSFPPNGFKISKVV